MKTSKVREVIDFDLASFAKDPDLRKMPWAIRKYIKYRVMELRAAKWREKEIAMALGITARAVSNTMLTYLRYDRLYEDMRMINPGRPSRFKHKQLSTIMSPEEL